MNRLRTRVAVLAILVVAGALSGCANPPAGPGVRFVVAIDSPPASSDEARALETQTAAALRDRFDALGVLADVEIDDGRLVVAIPRAQDAARAKAVAFDDVTVELKLVVYPPGVREFGSWTPPTSKEEVMATFGGALPPGAALFHEQTSSASAPGEGTPWWPLANDSVVTGRHIRDARATKDMFDSPSIDFELTAEGAHLLDAATRANIGRKLAILVGPPDDLKVVSAPVIQSVISGGRGQITGRFEMAAVVDLAAKLRSSLPAKLRIVAEEAYKPSWNETSPWRPSAFSTLGVPELLILLAVLVPCFVVPTLVVCLLLFVVFRRIPAVSRRLDPGLVWLLLIPCFGLVWNFVVFRRLSASLKAHFDSVGRTDVGDCGAGVGLACSICVACSIIPVVGMLTALASIVLLVVYLVKVYGLSAQIAET